jgi:hypothetical protein
VDPGFGTVLTAVLWIVIAVVRIMWPPDPWPSYWESPYAESWPGTDLIPLIACAVAIGLLVKDSLLATRSVRLANIIATVLAVLLLLLEGGSMVSAPRYATQHTPVSVRPAVVSVGGGS